MRSHFIFMLSVIQCWGPTSLQLIQLSYLSGYTYCYMCIKLNLATFKLTNHTYSPVQLCYCSKGYSFINILILCKFLPLIFVWKFVCAKWCYLFFSSTLVSFILGFLRIKRFLIMLSSHFYFLNSCFCFTGLVGSRTQFLL